MNIVNAFEGAKSDYPLIWLMRQAGRYMPEYRSLRKNSSSFLDLCYNSDLATQITMQPIKAFDFDAAIIFSDILVIPDAMGQKVTFLENQGPKLEEVNDFDKLSLDLKKLEPIYQAIKNVRNDLAPNKSLIGFAGSPWTIASYMIEQESSKMFLKPRIIAYLQSDYFTKLIDKLIDAISLHLINQASSGADVLQLFDSWAGVLNTDNYRKWVIEPTKKIVANIRKKYPDIKIIGFPRGSGILYEEYVKETGVDGISVDENVSLTFIKSNLQDKVLVQGNLDPVYLLGDRDILLKETYKILDSLSSGKHIFNLGHGVIKHTNPDNVSYLVDIVKGYKK